MTDELLSERLAISIAQPGPPQVRGEFVSVDALLYPVLLAPAIAAAALARPVPGSRPVASRTART